MQKHVENYFKALGYDESDTIICEACGQVACDVHHVTPRSKFGRLRKMERDDIENLIALCRLCHEEAHGVEARHLNDTFRRIIEQRRV
jgi:hypothetical protein